MKVSARGLGCFVIIVLLLFNLSFATTSISSVAGNQIDLISPSLSPKGEVFVDRSLQISVRLDSDAPLTMSLTKIESEIVNLDKIEAVKTTAYTLNAQQLSTPEKMKNTLEPLSSLQTGTETEQLKHKKQVMDLYTMIQQDYNAKRSRYDVIFLEMKSKYGASVLTLASEKPSLDPKMPALLKAYDEFKAIEWKYKLIKPLYDTLFERVILRAITVKIEGVMPYFNYDVKDTKSGVYRLDFFLQSDETQPVKTVDFQVKSKQDAVLTLINSIQDEIDEIWKIRQ